MTASAPQICSTHRFQVWHDAVTVPWTPAAAAPSSSSTLAGPRVLAADSAAIRQQAAQCTEVGPLLLQGLYTGRVDTPAASAQQALKSEAGPSTDAKQKKSQKQDKKEKALPIPTCTQEVVAAPRTKLHRQAILTSNRFVLLSAQLEAESQVVARPSWRPLPRPRPFSTDPMAATQYAATQDPSAVELELASPGSALTLSTTWRASAVAAPSQSASSVGQSSSSASQPRGGISTKKSKSTQPKEPKNKLVPSSAVTTATAAIATTSTAQLHATARFHMLHSRVDPWVAAAQPPAPPRLHRLSADPLNSPFPDTSQDPGHVQFTTWAASHATSYPGSAPMAPELATSRATATESQHSSIPQKRQHAIDVSHDPSQKKSRKAEKASKPAVSSKQPKETTAIKSRGDVEARTAGPRPAQVAVPIVQEIQTHSVGTPRFQIFHGRTETAVPSPRPPVPPTLRKLGHDPLLATTENSSGGTIRALWHTDPGHVQFTTWAAVHRRTEHDPETKSKADDRQQKKAPAVKSKKPPATPAVVAELSAPPAEALTSTTAETAATVSSVETETAPLPEKKEAEEEEEWVMVAADEAHDFVTGATPLSPFEETGEGTYTKVEDSAHAPLKPEEPLSQDVTRSMTATDDPLQQGLDDAPEEVHDRELDIAETADDADINYEQQPMPEVELLAMQEQGANKELILPSTNVTSTASVESTARVLVLCSNQSFSRDVISNQQRAFTLLEAKGIPYDTLDGADPANKDRRNELFELSGLRGKYPQFFRVVDGQTVFWGDWEKFDSVNDEGSLLSEFELSLSEPASTECSVAVELSQPASHDEKDESAVDTTAEPPNAISVLVLLSNQSLNREFTSKQQRALTLLDAKSIGYETLDGADPANKDRRNELFDLSGLRGKYPQFFRVVDGQTVFWGDWEKFEEANEQGALVAELGGREAPLRQNLIDIGVQDFHVDQKNGKSNGQVAEFGGEADKNRIQIFSETDDDDNKQSMTSDGNHAANSTTPSQEDFRPGDGAEGELTSNEPSFLGDIDEVEVSRQAQTSSRVASNTGSGGPGFEDIVAVRDVEGTSPPIDLASTCVPAGDVLGTTLSSNDDGRKNVVPYDSGEVNAEVLATLESVVGNTAISEIGVDGLVDSSVVVSQEYKPAPAEEDAPVGDADHDVQADALECAEEPKGDTEAINITDAVASGCEALVGEQEEGEQPSNDKVGENGIGLLDVREVDEAQPETVDKSTPEMADLGELEANEAKHCPNEVASPEVECQMDQHNGNAEHVSSSMENVAEPIMQRGVPVSDVAVEAISGQIKEPLGGDNPLNNVEERDTMDADAQLEEGDVPDEDNGQVQSTVASELVDVAEAAAPAYETVADEGENGEMGNMESSAVNDDDRGMDGERQDEGVLDIHEGEEAVAEKIEKGLEAVDIEPANVPEVADIGGVDTTESSHVEIEKASPESGAVDLIDQKDEGAANANVSNKTAPSDSSQPVVTSKHVDRTAPTQDGAGHGSRERGINIQDPGLTTPGSTHRQSRHSESEITIYGATSFVAKHVLEYLLPCSLELEKDLRVTLAGRSNEKLSKLQEVFASRMKNLSTVNPDMEGFCTFDTFVADSADAEALKKMAKRTKVVLNCAGPFSKYASNVVAACAIKGTDYVDITGEVSWASTMRAKYGKAAAKSGSRIISFCGFDSVPSDLSVYIAIQALWSAFGNRVDIASATTWHHILGVANGGTIQTLSSAPVDWKYCRSQPVPFLLDDPLALVAPKLREDPSMQETKNRLARAEWNNFLPSFDTILMLGVSIPFFMAPINAKIVHASALALDYGPKFVYRERFLPTGFQFTSHLKLLSIVPAIITMLAYALFATVARLPTVGQKLVDWFFPPGSGPSDALCQAGCSHVYAEVSTAPDATGCVSRANCFMSFKGDPGNWTTAQCVCESALALICDRASLPKRSKDGFGTPAELLGPVLCQRLVNSSVRPVTVKTHVRKIVSPPEWRMYP